MDDSDGEVVPARDRLVKWLRASPKITTTALALTLLDCTDEAPCMSGACLMCGLRFQQANVALIENVVEKPAQAHLRGRMSMVTIVPLSGIVRPGELKVEVFGQVMDEAKAALKKVQSPGGVFGLDVSYNEDLTGEVEPHWCVHTHGVTSDWWAATQRDELGRMFQATSAVKRPVRIDPLDDKPNARLYVGKPHRGRRETYLDETERGGRRPHRATRSKRLRPAQAVELATIEHRVGLRGRIFGHEVKDSTIARQLQAFVPDFEINQA